MVDGCGALYTIQERPLQALRNKAAKPNPHNIDINIFPVGDDKNFPSMIETNRII